MSATDHQRVKPPGHNMRLPEHIKDDKWKRHGKCHNDPVFKADPQAAGEFFFPFDSEATRRAHYCDDCGVKRICLAYALLIAETHGIWGGTTERSRRRLLRSGEADDIIASVYGEPATRRARRHNV